jgi:sulfite reductase beta subunit-like hemoprotein
MPVEESSTQLDGNGAVEGAASESAVTKAAPAPVDREAVRRAKNKLTDDGRLATMAELGDERANLTRNERIKIEKPGPKVWDDVVNRYSKEGFASIEEDDFERFKWIGWYQQRPKDGYFMMRLKITGGQVSGPQLRVISDIAKDYARGVVDITTRQTFQMHWLTIEQAPDIMDRLQTVGLGVKEGLFGACGDISRNVISSPLAGLEANEAIDVYEFASYANKYFSTHAEYADLPRKFKIGVFGRRDGGQVEINDLSFYGVKRADGTAGYGVKAGGGLSTEPHLAQDLNVFVKPEQALEVMEAVVRTFRDHGYRKNRKHARFKYLMADWGATKVREAVEEIIGYNLMDGEPQPRGKGYEDSLGVFPQKQEDFSYIGVTVVAGRLTTDQLDAVADIAQEFGSGDIRLTVMQNLLIPNVRNENIHRVLERLDAIGLPVEVSALRKGIVACTGIEFCNLAVVETKARAKTIINLLDEGVKWNESEFFRVNVNGCPNSCGQHWIADIGLQGARKKVDGQEVEFFDVYLGGGLGDHASGGARFNKRVKRITAEEVPAAINRAIENYRSKKQGDESFADFCARHSEEELAEMI